jgi:hypothetical protein
MNYQFGTYDETCDGKSFRVITSGAYDSDAQAERNAQDVLSDDAGVYDLTDMNGDKIKGILIRRGDVEWFV